ncbi:hypothetical protein BDZ85DRAFT_120158 [Elsinoe ampelina]|uniref:2',3'-cyclic-nucleotide 3'-phosphodiesterase n=1 Tax=Elsinoe ampelina TaxID=302913 RepID=A0A6A6GB74_9PEZI|nr:hypothetical protein BDZ85DRAFT_120158 [Elsinoe ampelina]
MPGSSLWLIPPKDPFNRAMQTQITSMVPMRFAPNKPPTFIPHITLTSHINPALHEHDAQAWLDSLELNIEALLAANETREKESTDSASAEKRALEAGNLDPPAPQAPTAPSDPEKAALSEDASISATTPAPPSAPSDPTSPPTSGPAPSQASQATTSPALPIEINLHELEAGDPFFRKLALNATLPSPGLSALATVLRAQGCYGNDIETAKSWEKSEYRPHLSLLYADVPKDEARRKIPGVLQDLVRAKAILKPSRDGTVSKGGSIVLVPTDREIGQWKPIASRPLPEVVWKLNMLL